MSSLNHSPASVRYLKARLRILKRPMVWGSAAVLLLTLFSVYTLLQRPEWLVVDERDRVSPASAAEAEANLGTDPGALPPEEDSAIGMEIDSLSVLRNEISNFDEAEDLDLLAQSPQSSGTRNGNTASAQAQTGSPLVGGSSQTSSTPQSFPSANTQNDRPLSLNLFDTPNLLSEGTASTNSDSASSVSSGLGLGTESQAQSAPPANPLRSAVEQYSNSPSQTSSQSQAQSSGTASSGSASTVSGQQPAITGLPTQPLNQYAPQTSPPPGTTGYTVPPSLYVPGGSYTNPGSTQPIQGLPQAPQVLPQTIPIQPGVGQSPVQSPYGTGTGNLTPNPNIQPQPVQPQPQPFSVPNPSAGYSIGGREVETFSNP